MARKFKKDFVFSTILNAEDIQASLCQSGFNDLVT